MDVLKTAAAVATPIALLSFGLGIYFLISDRRLKHKEAVLDRLPLRDRAQIADEELTRYGVSVGDSKPEDRVALLKEERKRKHALNMTLVFVLPILGIVLFAIASYCYVRSLSTPVGIKPSKAPDPISFVTAETYRSDKLPDAIFGSKTDEAGRHRQWMDTHERGAAAKLGGPQSRVFWLLSKPFDGPTLPYQAHVYVNTKSPVEIAAWVVSPRKKDVLPQTSGNGPDVVYHFDVPQTTAEERLLVFIAISAQDYEAINAVNKFSIQSELRSDATE